LKITYPPGATPLPLDWINDLIPDLATMGELNQFEAANILEATKLLTFTLDGSDAMTLVDVEARGRPGRR